MSAGSTTSPSTSSWRFPKHSVVEVHGLQSAADLNGKQGVVTDFNAEKQRYVVFVAGALKSLKEDNLRAKGGATRNNSSSKQQQQQQQPQGSSASSSSWSSTAEKFAFWTSRGKTEFLRVWNRAKIWSMSEGINMWYTSPLPKMILTFLVVGLAVYWMSSDPRYSSSTTATRDYATVEERQDTYRDDSYQRQDTYRESAYRDHRSQASSGYDTYTYGHNGGYHNARNGPRGGYDNYGGGRGYDDYGNAGYDNHYNNASYGGSGSRGGSSGFGMGMMLIIGAGIYYAYNQGWFARLRGMDFMQMFFLFSMLSNLFGGGMRMGRCGLGGLGGMGRRRGFF